MNPSFDNKPDSTRRNNKPSSNIDRSLQQIAAWLLPLLSVLVVLPFFITDAEVAWNSFPVDDAWIHRVYADSLASGRGFTYFEHPEAGFTSPLWVILTAPLHWLPSAYLVIGVKLTGLALLLVSAWAAIGVAAITVAAPTPGRLFPAVFLGCLIAVDPRLLFNAFSGMEVGLLLCIWLLANLSVARGAYWRAVACCALLPLARPETLVLAPLFCLVLLPWLRQDWRRLPMAACTVAIPLVLWLLFCLHSSGHPLPNTFYQKAGMPPLEPTMPFLLIQLFSQHGSLSPLILIAGWVLFTVDRSRERAWAQLHLGLTAPVLFGVAILLSREVNPSGYYWTRWFEPAALMLLLAALTGYARLLEHLWKAGIRSRAGSALLAAGLLVFSAPLWWTGLKDRSGHLVGDSRVINTLNVEPGLWIHSHTAPDARIGVNDAGALRFFSDRQVIDLVGLNNHRMLFDAAYQQQVWAELDWLVVYPWFPPAQVLDAFAPVKTFHVPVEQYTVCPCPLMQTVVIYARSAQTDDVATGPAAKFLR